jgi:site-specific DNA-methyltransferase (cytosine-N4-specific)
MGELSAHLANAMLGAHVTRARCRCVRMLASSRALAPRRYHRVVSRPGEASVRTARDGEDDATPDRIPGPAIRIGDAFDELPKLPRGSVHCVVTSPPYWGLRTYSHDHDREVLAKWKLVANNSVGDQATRQVPGYSWYRDHGGALGMEPYPEWFVSHLVEIFDRLRPALRPDANVWINLGDTYFARWSSIRYGRQGLGGGERDRRRTPAGGWLHDKQLLLIPARFAIAMQDAGWILRNDVIWSKPDIPPRPERDRLRLSHEHFFHFVLRRRGGRPKNYYDLEATESGSRDVVETRTNRPHRGHPASFPSELIRPRIASSSPANGVVLDPFCGSGRTLEVAIELGRQPIGIELSEDYASEAAKRISTALALGEAKAEDSDPTAARTPRQSA